MAKLLLISNSTANDNQIVDDIVSIYEDGMSISSIEQSIFNVLNCTNVTQEEIQSHFNSLRNDEAMYPKFAFSVATLTEQQKADLADEAVNHDDTMAIIALIPIKDPIE